MQCCSALLNIESRLNACHVKSDLLMYHAISSTFDVFMVTLQIKKKKKNPHMHGFNCFSDSQ